MAQPSSEILHGFDRFASETLKGLEIWKCGVSWLTFATEEKMIRAPRPSPSYARESMFRLAPVWQVNAKTRFYLRSYP
jgi:hypothetical protein